MRTVSMESRARRNAPEAEELRWDWHDITGDELGRWQWNSGGSVSNDAMRRLLRSQGKNPGDFGL